MNEAEAKIEAYLTRRIGEIRATQGPQDRSRDKSAFMMSTGAFAAAGFMTHDQMFEWNERMFREVG